MMLRLRWLLVFIVLGAGGNSLLHAQYLPTAVEGANWVLIDSEFDYPYSAYIDRIEGDIIVGEYAYKKLYRYTIDYIEVQTSPPLEPPYDLLPGRQLISLLRDDTINRRVYGKVFNYYSSGTTISADTLLHNYSLGVGDTLTGLFFATGFNWIEVTEIGVEDRFGMERRFQASYSLKMYEGVGSMYYGPMSGSIDIGLNCCNFRLLDYCVGDFPDCGLILSSTNELSESVSLTTHPNPLPPTLNVQLSAPLPSLVSVTLYDLNGRVLREATFRDSLRWELSDLSAGVYVAVFTHEGARVMRRVVKG